MQFVSRFGYGMVAVKCGTKIIDIFEYGTVAESIWREKHLNFDMVYAWFKS